MLALTPVIIQLIEAGLTIAPQIMAAWKTEVALFTAGTPPTDAQKAEIDAALDAADAALQAAQPTS